MVAFEVPEPGVLGVPSALAFLADGEGMDMEGPVRVKFGSSGSCRSTTAKVAHASDEVFQERPYRATRPDVGSSVNFDQVRKAALDCTLNLPFGPVPVGSSDPRPIGVCREELGSGLRSPPMVLVTAKPAAALPPEQPGSVLRR
ncbi:hypothetical protein RhiJN_11729 [Ceratobasidium sp. AG-Ba]|nr:hypothetical protein RhiJN_11729 [Ceratobasidium sp. AG-Ba]